MEHIPLSPAAEAELRHRARMRSTHYSTSIEGNRLTLAEAERAIAGQDAGFEGRERDVGEVRNYWRALLRMEEWARAGLPLSEDLIRRLHALVEKGARAKPTPYRDGQNAVRDSASKALIYLPPWLEYFIPILARVFTLAKDEASRFAAEGLPDIPGALRRLDPRARAVIALFAKQERITSNDVARTLGLSQRMARELLRVWTKDGWLTTADASNRARAYALSANYRQYIGKQR